MRFAAAFERRVYADSLIRYHYYIDNMPSDEIPELEQDQVMTIVELSLNSRAFKGRPTPDTTNLITEVNQDFAKTMNKIIFNKHMKGKGKELIAGNLTLPPPPKAKAVPFFGMISSIISLKNSQRSALILSTSRTNQS